MNQREELKINPDQMDKWVLMAGLKYCTIRNLARNEKTIKRALESEVGILQPMYKYFDKKEIEYEWVRKNDRSEK